MRQEGDASSKKKKIARSQDMAPTAGVQQGRDAAGRLALPQLPPCTANTETLPHKGECLHSTLTHHPLCHLHNT